MNNNELSLAFSMQSNPGVYALLLGSGISYSSGIKTGWGILQELCRRIMVLNGEEMGDPIKWYQNTYGKPALYDEVIEQLAFTSSERNGLLNEFFEPTIDELQNHIKAPTNAHKAIAKLVKRGYIKVIVTTNFDRLLEQALDAENVPYQTVYHETDIEGMKPLTHIACTVFKVHGDYRDTRFKNISDELKEYSEPVNKLLKQIFDEYGLIISGWSAEWDTALRSAIKSVKGRRYSWYWNSLNKNVSEPAKDLIIFRDAVQIEGTADRIFSELLNNVTTIEKLKREDPRTLQVLSTKVKDYIYDKKEAELNDLILQETIKLKEYINSVNANIDFDREIYNSLIQEYVTQSKTLATLMSILAYYGNDKTNVRLMIETLERFTTGYKGSGKTDILDLQFLPLILITYSIGISLVKAGKFDVLNQVMMKPRVRDPLYQNGNENKFLHYSSPFRTLYQPLKRYWQDRDYHIPTSFFLVSHLEEIFINSMLVFDKEELVFVFDFYEFLLSLKHRKENVNGFFSGQFGFSLNRKHLEHFLVEGHKEGENWPVLQLFDSRIEVFNNNFDHLVNDLENQVYATGRGLNRAYREGILSL